MTRPSGTTPNGLPFPGSIDIHARTPAALQALAEAIESKLTAISPGVILDAWRGVVQVGQYGSAHGGITVPFPRLAAVTGWIGCYGVDDGGGLQDGYITNLFTSSNGLGYYCSAPWASGRATSAITIHAVGWGPPR
jgi:hypothetical protein